MSRQSLIKTTIMANGRIQVVEMNPDPLGCALDMDRQAGHAAAQWRWHAWRARHWKKRANRMANYALLWFVLALWGWWGHLP